MHQYVLLNPRSIICPAYSSMRQQALPTKEFPRLILVLFNSPFIAPFYEGSIVFEANRQPIVCHRNTPESSKYDDGFGRDRLTVFCFAAIIRLTAGE
jgi:hypothetical protein